jgi:acetoin utilization protein AcuC
MKPERLRRTFELLKELGTLESDGVQIVEPQIATEDELALFHTEEYIEVTRGLSRGNGDLPGSRYGYGPGDNPVFSGMYETEGLKVGSALTGARMLLADECDVAFSYGGGMHHGGPDFASGFNVFNDCAVAIQWLLDQGQRVAYVDIDVHHCDGVQDAFYESDRVLTISLHQDGRTLFPGTGFVEETGKDEGVGFSVNVPLPPLTFNEPYLRAFDEIVPPMLRRFEADILVTQLGVDTHYTDPLASLALTTQLHQQLYEKLEQLAPRWLALGGGGYAIDVVPRSWSLAFAAMSGQQLRKTLPTEYRKLYGGHYIHDRQQPDLSEAIRLRVDEVVDGIIGQVKQAHRID